jgi:ferredoxin
MSTSTEGIVIEIDRELCYGFGDCVSALPDVFQLDDEDKSVVVDPNAGSQDDLVEAASDCPVNAITIRDTSTGETLFP